MFPRALLLSRFFSLLQSIGNRHETLRGVGSIPAAGELFLAPSRSLNMDFERLVVWTRRMGFPVSRCMHPLNNLVLGLTKQVERGLRKGPTLGIMAET